jgi:hypothetical protein
MSTTEQLDFFGGERDFLAELKRNWAKTIEGDGGHCPCCEKWGKINNYVLNETMAATLKWMTVASTDHAGYIDMGSKAPRWSVRAKNFTTMKFWGFVEPAPKARPKDKNVTGLVTKTSGLWRVTERGRAFVYGGLTVPIRAFVYDDRFFGWGDKMTTFERCFGRKFNYEDVMATNFNWFTLRRDL